MAVEYLYEGGDLSNSKTLCLKNVNNCIVCGNEDFHMNKYFNKITSKIFSNKFHPEGIEVIKYHIGRGLSKHTHECVIQILLIILETHPH